MSKKFDFEWVEPSLKQQDILYWWTPSSPYKDYSYIAIEGAVRSAKTISASFSFINWASYTYDNEDLALTAKTIGTAIRNIVRPLRRILNSEPNYTVKFVRGREEGSHLDVTDEDLGHSNTFWLYGGKDESSQDLIQGKTLAGILLDEAPLMPQSFINQGLARLSVEGAKAWFISNPETPAHPFYVETLDPLQEAGKLYYLHLTMDDNPSLSEEAKNRIKSQWPKGSLLYRRYILGERAAAEGRVYSFFDERLEAGYVINPEQIPKAFAQYLIGLDYGIANPFAAALWGFYQNTWYCLKEFYHDSIKEQKQKTNAEYITDLSRLCFWDDRLIVPNKILVPPEEPGFQREIKQSQYKQLQNVRDCDNAILPGIEDVTSLLALGKLKISSDCKMMIWGLNNLLWDTKKQQQGIDMHMKGGSGSPDHICDAIRYMAREGAKQLRQMKLIS